MTDNTQAEWLESVHVGSEVWWNDPDRGLSSGYYVVHDLQVEEAECLTPDCILSLKSKEGSETEVFGHELSPRKPDGLYPVLNSEAEIMGYAFTSDEAEEVFDDELPDGVELVVKDGVQLIDGTHAEKAWVLV